MSAGRRIWPASTRAPSSARALPLSEYRRVSNRTPRFFAAPLMIAPGNMRYETTGMLVILMKGR